MSPARCCRAPGFRRWALVLTVAQATPGLAQAVPDAGVGRRGPLEVRENWLLAQPRLVLAAAPAELPESGGGELRLDFAWGNDLGWNQDEGGEQPRVRRFLVDGEHRTLALTWRRRLAPRVAFEVRLPWRARGGGVLDGVIDWWHGFTRRLGLPDNQRPRFARDRLRVLGRTRAGTELAWEGTAGSGLGRAELGARLALNGAATQPRRRSGWALSLAPRVALPTGSGPFDTPGVEAGAQLLAARPLGSVWDWYLGAGAVAGGPLRAQGLTYTRLRPHAFSAWEWRPARRLSLLAQVDAAGRLLNDVEAYPGLQCYLRLGVQLDLGERARWRLAGGFSENLVDQQATTDFDVFLGLARRF